MKRRLALLSSLLLAACNSAGPPPSATPPTAPGLTLAAKKTYSANESLAFDLRFANPGEDDVTIITPQDGSTYGWLSPAYTFTIERISDGKPAGLMGRCGNHGATYNERTMRVVAPSASTSLQISAWHEMPGPGRYRATLTYTVKPNAYPGPHYSAPSTEDPTWGAWPAGVFVGSVASNTVEFDYTPER